MRLRDGERFFPAKEESRRDVPRWVLTYADMVSLLVTFFILLMTYSSMEQEMYSKMAGSVLGAFGVISDPNTPNHEAIDEPPPTIANRVPEDGIRSSRRDLERLEEGLQILVQRIDVGQRIDFERTQHGIRLRLLQDFAYAPGQALLTEGARRSLREIADLVRIHQQPVRVVGHAWAEGRDARGEDWEPMEVASERALVAAAYLREVGRVPASRLEVAARGDREPLRVASDERSTQRNRRLEVWILPVAEGDRP